MLKSCTSVLQYLFVNTLPFLFARAHSAKKYFTSILRERTPFWQLARFAVRENAKFFVHEKLNSLLSKTFLYANEVESFVRKKIKNLRDEFLQMSLKTLRNRLSCVPKKDSITSLK